jgi:hypothetical protein
VKRAITTAMALLALAATSARAQLLPDGDCAGVYWDLTAQFASGDRVYARVLVTRAGPGDRNAAGVGWWIQPDGTQTHFQNGRGDGEFSFDEAARRVRIGSTRLDLSGRPIFEVDNDKRGVKLRLEIGIAPRAQPIAVFFGDPEVELLALGRATTARVWRTGMTAPRELRGFATLVRTRHRACESERSALRVDVHRFPPGGAALLIHERLADGAQRSWFGWWDERGPQLRVLRPEAIALEDWRAEGDGPAIPHRLRPTAGALGGDVAIGAAQLSVDPLEALPRLVRMLYWFGARPRRIWSDATSGLAASGPDALPRGAAIASFSFLRPLEDASRSRSSESGG